MCARNSSGSGTPRSTSSRSGSSTATELSPGSAVASAQQLRGNSAQFGPSCLSLRCFSVNSSSLTAAALGAVFINNEDEGVTHEKGQEGSSGSNAGRHRNGGSGRKHGAGTRRDRLVSRRFDRTVAIQGRLHWFCRRR